MKTKEYLKRFCFGITEQTDMEGKIYDALKEINSSKSISNAGIENVEIFKGSYFYFMIVDVQTYLNLENIKNMLKQNIIMDIISSEQTFLLDRIFKKETTENHYTEKIYNYQRSILTLELQNDTALLEEYIEIHKPENMWPQILDNMGAIGVIDMEIYLHGYRAFLIMDVLPDFNMRKDGVRWANLPQEKEWQQYVSKFQKVNSKDKGIEKWKTMELIFGNR